MAHCKGQYQLCDVDRKLAFVGFLPPCVFRYVFVVATLQRPPPVTVEKNGRSFNAVRSRAAQLRLRAMRSQLAAASNFCSTAANAATLGQVQLGLDAVQKAKHTAQWVRVHLEEPNHIPADAVAGIRDELAALQRQISDLEAGLRS